MQNNNEKISFVLNELITNHSTTSIQEVFSNEYIVHTSKKDYQGHKIIIKWAKDLHNFFADLKIVKIQFLVQTDEFIVWKRTLRGKIKPSKNKNLKTSKTIQWDEMIVSKFKNGFIIEEWNNSEFLGVLFSKPN
ncbi:ester cyclase [Leptospira bandrabouensis]|uniref:ester cyclase n=1 Tax=Leptospira bandrabouensis TaxID=2484903 RepID=UPI00223D89E3|nr:ester cyclase [Leptospira bandrabouensis]MCW7457436.1 ester cyclase [Leptospira bandrabouensis]MCW7476288.1 ester cyclase [Leptospira bandrabouensis]MCW7483971.1 ester cyclase [Leptospira bandrabouensis]